ncbi:formyltetrahydrofolate deformylase [Oceanicola granulosus HTCC2516]|uniref:Formyltetrahydrofolate deformylase n=1 Tax=Oceanicola granulosus (strain ATCC BAA-861 / DSM 15982 / KCTC 12143 / HTCC2516) TaxID=314256 RepID=Q2CH37_OCEGH|nr:formyltetrahydrofolate deformylase [Oceanicola granulosus]EAR51974.1 formyltetrahydrofolate deformylase [Oceanicola granulosus HTCC2516]
MAHYNLTLSCPTAPGIVAAISGELARREGNIVDSAQFNDAEAGRFFMRLSFTTDTPRAALEAGLADIAAPLGIDWTLRARTEKLGIVILVSRFGHCLNDLLYRARIGALPVEIRAVISNHRDYARAVENEGIPFHHIPVTPETKADAEAATLRVVEETEAGLVVLARYMQVLSEEMCRRMSGRIINIHHSFLPSFKGANPYRQAHRKGVRLIGATAHYVTADLDEGPIIEQDTVRVTHAQSPQDYVALGRDVEAQVLARAVQAHAHGRVLLNGDRTVVFPAGPGEHASERMG